MRGRDAEAAAASRLRADALLAGGRPAPGPRAGRARETPSWASARGSDAPERGSSAREDLDGNGSPRGCAAAGAPVPAPTAPAATVASQAPAVRLPWWRTAGPALRERLPLWVHLRCGLAPKSLAALAVVLVGAAVLAATHYWSGRPQPVPAPEQVKEAAAAHPAAPASSGTQGPDLFPGASAGSPASLASTGRIVVDVSGKVRRPGIQHLPSGSRVADALRAAGGAREGADVTGLNQARVLTDGEQVLVGLPAAQSAAAGAEGSGGSGTAQAGPTAPVSLSTATVEQLDTLPGVGPVLAQHIIDYRTEHGGYRSVDELREVDGIGDRRFADLRPLVRP
ncbi:hypothetical protein GCM10010392_19080 [Streptomyces clavifer]|nr:ComEA family DNA-binding protein [Streptomyces sp. NRRL_B-2557]GHA92780.1 hypothetical protein GCM10010392_19080 [Streptomyces clavifer]